MSKDTTFGTLLRALAVCFVCSIVVSVVVVLLRPMQEANRLADKQGSALEAAGINVTEGQTINSVFSEKMETRIVDLDTGEFISDADLTRLGINPAEYNFVDAADKAEFTYAIKTDLAKIGNHAKYMPVYLIKGGEFAGGIVLPVYGKGLWSTLYGYLALEKDGNTIINLKFYDQKETPGLGGRIADDNNWLASWKGKFVYGASGEPQIALVKGRSPAGSEAANYEIDSLSGASLTSVGVTNLLQYWMGEEGYRPFMQKFQSGRLSDLPDTEASTIVPSAVISGLTADDAPEEQATEEGES